jgi:hypothetical protein
MMNRQNKSKEWIATPLFTYQCVRIHLNGRTSRVKFWGRTLDKAVLSTSLINSPGYPKHGSSTNFS